MAAITSKMVVTIATTGVGLGQEVPAKSQFEGTALTAGNLAAQTSLAQALSDAIQNLTTGIVRAWNFTIGTPVSSTALTVTANRSEKWIVTGQETTGNLRKFTYTIPAGDTNKALAGTIDYDAANADWIAFVSAFNAYAKSPAGNALTFRGAKLGGRRA